MSISAVAGRSAVAFAAALLVAVAFGLTTPFDNAYGVDLDLATNSSTPAPLHSEFTSFAPDADIEELLERPYEPGVPAGFSEDIFALYSPGWGFDSDSLNRTGIDASHRLPVMITANGTPIPIGSATSRPSTVISESAPTETSGNVLTASTPLAASFTSAWDRIEDLTDGLISYDDSPRSRWSNWTAEPRTQEEWVTVDLAGVTRISAVRALVYSDGGGVAPPSALAVDVWGDGGWEPVTGASAAPAVPAVQLNTVTFDAVETTKVRLRLTPQPGKAVALTELEVWRDGVDGATLPVSVVGHKFISDENVASVVLEVSNTGSESPITVQVSASSPSAPVRSGDDLVGAGSGFELRVAGDGFAPDDAGSITRIVEVPAGETAQFRLGLAFDATQQGTSAALERFFADDDPVESQRSTFLSWFAQNVPSFDTPDIEFLRTYYFRWFTYRNHIRKTQEGSYIVSEFLPNVPWATQDNAISAPVGHHFYEGRWIRDPKYLDDYETFWFNGVDHGPYSEWFADAYNARHAVLGNDQLLVDHDLLASLVANFRDWELSNQDANGLYAIADNPDAMENSISGFGPNYRPTINSYEYGDAVAIADIATRLGDAATAAEFTDKAAVIKSNVQALLWDDGDQFFKVRIKSSNALADVREQLGYIPWYFGLPDEGKYSEAWAQVMDPQGFYASYGPTTAERRDPGFQQRTVNVDCEWNGPSWPFATSQTLTGMARLLQDYDQDVVSENDYFTLLSNYSASHRKNGYPWIAENLHADTGAWIADFARSPNYNHSTFADLVITGLAGIRPSTSDQLDIRPLLPEGIWSHFALENVPYHGHNVSILWDEDGAAYGQGAGLHVYLDGALEASSPELGDLQIDLNAPDPTLTRSPVPTTSDGAPLSTTFREPSRTGRRRHARGREGTLGGR